MIQSTVRFRSRAGVTLVVALIAAGCGPTASESLLEVLNNNDAAAAQSDRSTPEPRPESGHPHGDGTQTSAGGPGQEPTAPNNLVGEIDGADALIGLVANEKEILAYVCDGDESGKSISAWFHGEHEDGRFWLQPVGAEEGDNAGYSPSGYGYGQVLWGSIRGGQASGTLSLDDGTELRWSAKAPAADSPAGLYAATDDESLTSVVIGDEGRALGLSFFRASRFRSRVTVSKRLVAAPTQLVTVIRPDRRQIRRPVRIVTSRFAWLLRSLRPKPVPTIPAAAGPGQLVRLKPERAGPYPSLRVNIGKQGVTVVHSSNLAQIDVLVPNLEPGSYVIRAYNGSRSLGKWTLQVLPSTARQLVLHIDRQSVRVIDSQARGGGFVERADEGGRRLSFDVFTIGGNFVFTGVTTHPLTGRDEVHLGDERGQMFREKDRDGATFSIKIPNVPGGAIVDFYEVGEGLDVQTIDGRKLRDFFSTIQIGG